ncbi:sensor histidine kinase [Nocardiopsis changdeensis]|uniref:histidine kinase n=1 Tax=Nocardiopsis changdeensis TaxID=2831969 RepID=A0ABX8BIH4_9ACTN|nr:MULTISPECIES: sensor histidine kinase [Nocardiopsis]QUX20198.1 sensor histidine kinase [Nocardiopsis changdeensis]QYX36126.1 sensor histidine kinase [Nocardiopsis sp. MT53]
MTRRDTGERDTGEHVFGAGADAAIAAVTALALLGAETFFSLDRGSAPQPQSLAVLALGAASLALVGRRPLVTAVAVGLCLPLYYVAGTADTWAAWLLLLVAVLRMAAVGLRTAPVVTVAVALGLFAVAEAFAFNPWRALLVLAWTVAIAAVAAVLHQRAAHLRAAQERALEAERTREEEARRRATEERLRIARELHDVIAHDISLVNVQASAAVHRRDPEQALEALEAIKAITKDTLRELRATLGVLRQVDEAEGNAPVPGTDRLPHLVRAAAEGGPPARLTVDGAPAGGPAEMPAVPAPVGAALYRIVQEALTNVRRHSDATAVEVALTTEPGAVTVRVSDDGSATAEPVEGNGLTGMRERVTALGGTFEAGPGTGGGFRVRARLPVDRDD